MRFTKKPIIWGIICLSLFVIFLNSKNINDQKSPIQEQTQRIQNYTLALTWHEGFCKNNNHKKECQKQAINSYAQKNFVLHGLWPGMKGQYYCDEKRIPFSLGEIIIEDDKKSARWHQLPELNLDPKLKKDLFEKMPGTLSFLHRHEWVKHGSCFIDRSPNSYYTVSLKLQDSFNEAVLTEFIKINQGKIISVEQVKNAFAEIFGSNASKSISMKCKPWSGKLIITEIRINLKASLEQLNNISVETMPHIMHRNTSKSCVRALLI